jgi:enoyl-CoA hydratase/carnithine racemase
MMTMKENCAAGGRRHNEEQIFVWFPLLTAIMFARKFSTTLCSKRRLGINTFSLRWHSDASTADRTAVEHDSRVLKVDQADGVLTLTLNRPEQRNALNRSLLESLKEELEQASQRPSEIRAIVIQGEGSTVFSSGHDLKELSSLDESGQKEVLQLCSDVMQLLPNIPQPTIGAVEGLAMAAGCQLVAACDLVVANPRSGYATPGGTTIGLFCHTPAVPLVRSIGMKRAMDMLFTGRRLSAPEAMEYGLITRMAANPRREAAKLGQQIADQSACAMQSGKQILYEQASTENLAEAYNLASQAMLTNLQTSDAKTGIESFLQKKSTPKWKHK